MKVILKETINSLGIIGSEVAVADGYARNYLLPQDKAVLATPQNRRKMEHEKAPRNSKALCVRYQPRSVRKTGSTDR
jgi:ribosomal protein L9